MITAPGELPIEIKNYYEELGFEIIEIIDDFMYAHKRDSMSIIGFISLYNHKRCYYFYERVFREETMLKAIKLKAFF